MKSAMKICIAVSIALLLFGFVCIGVGAAMGVHPTQLVYSGPYPGRFSLRTDLITVIPEESGTGLPDLPLLEGSNPDGAEEYYEFHDIDRLDLELGLCELQILAHEEDYIAVAADNCRNYFQCSQKNNTLALKDDRKTSTKQNSLNQALRLKLYLPEQEFSEVSIEIGAGNLTFDALSAGVLELENGTGNIFIGTMSCRTLDVDTGVGEFNAESLTVMDEAEIDIGTGTALIAYFDGSSLELDCGAGNAEVTAAGSEQDYNYTIETLGSISLNHHYYEDHESHHGSHHNNDFCLDVDHHAGRTISIQCGIGDAALNFTEE